MAKILIIDPSPVDRKRMRSLLEAAGHAVAEASTPAEAMSGLLSKPGTVSLVLTELAFPDETGLELLRWLNQQDRLQTLSVIVVTEQPPRDTLIAIIAAGAATVVTKPFGPDLLLRRVTDTLAERLVISQGEGLNLSWQIPDYVKRELKRAERSKSHLSVAVCRVLEPGGDQAVPRLMARLVHVIREYDVLARLGAHEVVILLPDADVSGAGVVLQRISGVVEGLEQVPPEGAGLPFTVAVGVATYPAEVPDGESLIALARSRAVAAPALNRSE
jgi:PleD family two-component response regulator